MEVETSVWVLAETLRVSKLVHWEKYF